MSERILIICATCGRERDVTETARSVVASGKRPAGWRPRVCSTCLWDALIEMSDRAGSRHVTDRTQ